MNIFYLDENPITCSCYHNDKHCLKMLVEYTQLICTAVRLVCPPESVHYSAYKATHINHPCSIWVRQSMFHLEYLMNLVYYLNREYRTRFRHQQDHASYTIAWRLTDLRHDFPNIPLEDPPQCMPVEYKEALADNSLFGLEDHTAAVVAYRNYYKGEKAGFSTYRHGRIPSFMQGHLNEELQAQASARYSNG